MIDHAKYQNKLLLLATLVVNRCIDHAYCGCGQRYERKDEDEDECQEYSQPGFIML